MCVCEGEPVGKRRTGDYIGRIKTKFKHVHTSQDCNTGRLEWENNKLTWQTEGVDGQVA